MVRLSAGRLEFSSRRTSSHVPGRREQHLQRRQTLLTTPNPEFDSDTRARCSATMATAGPQAEPAARAQGGTGGTRPLRKASDVCSPGNGINDSCCNSNNLHCLPGVALAAAGATRPDRHLLSHGFQCFDSDDAGSGLERL